MTFKDFDLSEGSLGQLDQAGYQIPTPIQQEAIPILLQGQDLIGVAETGTGKTLAFLLPIFEGLEPGGSDAQAIVICPTRELAIQIEESFATYGRHLRLRQALVYGGVSQRNQVRALNRGAHTLVATLGRLLDLMHQGHIKLNQLEVFVLDEADRLLDMGFIRDVKRIINMLPKRRQSLLFSATMPAEVSKLAAEMLNQPIRVDVSPKVITVEKIDQHFVYSG